MAINSSDVFTEFGVDLEGRFPPEALHKRRTHPETSMPWKRCPPTDPHWVKGVPSLVFDRNASPDDRVELMAAHFLRQLEEAESKIFMLTGILRSLEKRTDFHMSDLSKLWEDWERRGARSRQENTRPDNTTRNRNVPDSSMPDRSTVRPTTPKATPPDMTPDTVPPKFKATPAVHGPVSRTYKAPPPGFGPEPNVGPIPKTPPPRIFSAPGTPPYKAPPSDAPPLDHARPAPGALPYKAPPLDNARPERVSALRSYKAPAPAVRPKTEPDRSRTPVQAMPYSGPTYGPWPLDRRQEDGSRTTNESRTDSRPVPDPEAMDQLNRSIRERDARRTDNVAEAPPDIHQLSGREFLAEDFLGGASSASSGSLLSVPPDFSIASLEANPPSPKRKKSH